MIRKEYEKSVKMILREFEKDQRKFEMNSTEVRKAFAQSSR